jgi:hypothetical protein
MEAETVRVLVLAGVYVVGIGAIVGAGLVLVHIAERVASRGARLRRTPRRARASRVASPTTTARRVHKKQTTWPEPEVRA